MPSGTEKNIDSKVTLRVPINNGQMPYLGTSETGCHTWSGAS